MLVLPMGCRQAAAIVIAKHYLHRKPAISFAFGLYHSDVIHGVITFGAPASHSVMLSACRTAPNSVIELSRLWVSDALPRNTESWFVSRALRLLPPRIVISYADTSVGHFGYIYRAANFFYAGWTDMERKTPRFDYVVPGKHSRDAFRHGQRAYTDRIRRKPKVKYWTITGNRRDRRNLETICLWPKMDWHLNPPPVEHHQL